MTIKNGKLILLMILITGAMTIPVLAQDWYQDVFDECENFTNVAGFSDGMIANGTFWGFNNSMQGSSILEDTGDYTEGDPFNWITINSASSVTISADMNEPAFLYRDIGADNIGDFDVTFSVDPISHISNGRAYAFMISKTLGAGIVNSELIGYRVRFSTGDAKYQHALVTRESGVNTLSVYLEPSGDPIRYARVTKVGANVTLWIYDDAPHTSLLFSTSHTLASNKTYRYRYWVSSDDVNTAGRVMEIQVDDLRIFSDGGLTSGIIYSVGIPNTSTKPMILSTQVELDPGNQIFVQFSNDNMTWVNEQNVIGGSVNIVTGWKAFNLEKMDWSIVYFRFNLSKPSGSGDCEIRQWRLFYRETPEPSGNVTILAGAFATYNVSSIETLVGDYVHGNLTSTQFVDGKTYLVDEVTGVPGWDIRYNFTGVPENSTSLAFMGFADYEGNPAHDPHIEAYNFEIGEFIDMVEYGEGAFEWHNASLSIGGFIQNDTGNVWIRFVHHESGSNGHFINVDYLRLRAFVPTGGVDPNLDAWSINWLLSIIWIALVAIGIFDQNKIIIMFAGFFGVILSILMLTENMMVAVALLCINLYLLYEGTK